MSELKKRIGIIGGSGLYAMEGLKIIDKLGNELNQSPLKKKCEL